MYVACSGLPGCMLVIFISGTPESPVLLRSCWGIPVNGRGVGVTGWNSAVTTLYFWFVLDVL